MKNLLSMTFDKTKSMRAAEKYLAQGKIPSAVKEYKKIVDNDPKDYTALNMLGDLYVRVEKKDEALQCFSLIADHYREQGFSLKAIAMYKKIDRLNPGTLDIAKKLAALYDQMGLSVEARQQYLVVADAYSKAGQTQKALEVLRKIADLDPHNAEVRLKLGEGFLHEGFQQQACEAFVEAGSEFITRGMFERALTAFKQTLEVNPAHHGALNGLVITQGKMGTAYETAELLEKTLARNPEDLELTSLLAKAYVEAEDATAAERVVSKLVDKEPSTYSRFVDVARLYLKEGQVDKAVHVLSRVAEPMLAGREDDVLLSLINEALVVNPMQLPALRMLVRIHSWQGDDKKLKSSLERLVDAAEAVGLVDEQRSALSQLIRITPDNAQYEARLREIGPLSESTSSGSANAVPSMDESIPTFESFIHSYDAGTADVVEEAPQYEFNQAAEQPEIERNGESYVTPGDFGDFVDNTMTTTHVSDYSEVDFNTVPQAAVEAEPKKSGREDALKQEIESVDFYLAQGYYDIAKETLTMLERDYGTEPEIADRKQKLADALSSKEPEVSAPTYLDATKIEEAGFEISSGAELVAEPQVSLPVELVSEPSVELTAEPAPKPEPKAPTKKASGSKKQADSKDEGLDPGLADVFNEFRAAVESETQVAEADFETHYNLGLAYQEMDLLSEAVEEFQTAIGLISPQDGTPRYLRCCNLLGHCFMRKGMLPLAIMWFKKGTESPGHTEEEYQALRYELGRAYEQNGDIERAIEIFTEVYGVNVSYRGVAEKLRQLQEQLDKQ
jgi:tetratricopeptide (TPR) repeat protein